MAIEAYEPIKEKPMKALWLASWYPDRLDRFNGDFIQRHAIAASNFCSIDLFHVHPDTEGEIQSTEIIVTQRNQRLTETIMLLPFSNGLFSSFYNQYNYFKEFKTLLDEHIHRNGKPDIVHLHVPIKAGLLALYLKRKYRIPFVVTEHWGIYNHVAENHFHTRHLWFKQLTTRVFRQAAAFFPVSEDLGAAVNKMVCKTAFKVIRNAVDTGYFYFDEALEKQSGIFHFLHASTMGPGKNAEGILRVFAKLHAHYPNTSLSLIGAVRPDLETAYASLVESGAIIFGGVVSYELVADYMRQSDCFILFSAHENMPCVIQESLCCGLPVIATNVGGIPEVINDSNGILINEDEDELLAAMEKMIVSAAQYPKASIAAAAQEAFDYNAIGSEIVQEYEKLLANFQA